MSEENKNKSHRGFTMVIAVAIAIPVIYVLSIGPVGAICQKYPQTWPAFNIFYYPLIWLAHDSPLRSVLEPPLDFYIRLWRV